MHPRESCRCCTQIVSHPQQAAVPFAVPNGRAHRFFQIHKGSRLARAVTPPLEPPTGASARARYTPRISHVGRRRIHGRGFPAIFRGPRAVMEDRACARSGNSADALADNESHSWNHRVTFSFPNGRGLVVAQDRLACYECPLNSFCLGWGVEWREFGGLDRWT